MSPIAGFLSKAKEKLANRGKVAPGDDVEVAEKDAEAQREEESEESLTDDERKPVKHRSQRSHSGAISKQLKPK